MKKCLQVKKPVSCVDFLAEEGALYSAFITRMYANLYSSFGQRSSSLGSTMLGK